MDHANWPRVDFSSLYRFCANFFKSTSMNFRMFQRQWRCGLWVCCRLCCFVIILPPLWSHASDATDCTFWKSIHLCTATCFFRVSVQCMLSCLSMHLIPRILGTLNMAIFMLDLPQCLSQNEISIDRPNSNNSVTGRQFMWNFQFGIGAPAEILIFIIPSFWKLIPHMNMPGFENTA